MTLRVTSAFDGGNAEVLEASSPSSIRLAIRKDAGDLFMQWFSFRVSGCRDADLVIRIENAGEASHAGGFEGYRAVASPTRRAWLRVPTEYAAGVLTLRHRPREDVCYFAYFVPYPAERHADLIARCAADERVRLEVLGTTLDGRDLDCLRVGHGPLQIFCVGRQHPGETMAEHWMEGFLERLLDQDAAVRDRLEAATFHVVPNMNPDGSARGHHRTNAAGADLNREWLEPSMERSPEVFLVRERMNAVGVDLCLDVHGDEQLPYSFVVGPDGVPSLDTQQRELLARFRRDLAARSPDFQTERGYPPSKPGKADLRLCANYVAETFGCLAMTLEMPFKDSLNNPNRETGWSPARSAEMGRACLDVILGVAEHLRVVLRRERVARGAHESP